MPDSRSRFTRRSVLSLAVAGAASALPKLSAAGGGHRAIVVIHLMGGNDANNLIVPLDDGPYARYARTRGELALASGSLLPVKTLRGDRTYGFHPAIPELRDLYSQGQLAVVANVGARTRPSTGGLDSFTYVRGAFAMPRWADAGGILEERVVGFEETGVAVLPLGRSNAGRDTGWKRAMGTARAPQVPASFPDTGMGRALQHVAGMIASQDGPSVYFASMGGFATLSNQLTQQEALLRTLSESLGAFYRSLLELGAANRVTTVTDSEMGRSAFPNKSHGSGPGWGTHHLVLGAAVQGGHIHGEIPDLSAAALESDGALVPTTDRSQYEATLHGWLHSRRPVTSLDFLA